jgi:hypothetical protein
MKKNNKNDIQEGKPTRAETSHGSATQGGSNFGQGSTQLGTNSEKQGSESNDGANYNGEADWNNEALRMEDLPANKKKSAGDKKK